MTAPSVARLTAAFRDLDRANARLIRKLARAVSDEQTLRSLIEKRCPATDAYARRCYSNPYDSGMWRRTLALHAIDVILGTHGVEPLGEPPSFRDGPPYEYCNAGDTYATTLIYHRAPDALRIGCWGDLAEKGYV
jgi:hypothetical protein